MFSEEQLLRNLAVLEEMQGHRPALSAPDPATTRVSDAGGTLRIDVRSAAGAWVPLWSADPDAEARLQLAVTAGAAHVFLIGGGVGHLLDAIEDAQSAAGVLILEPDPAIAALMLARRDWRAWLRSGRLRLLVGPDYIGTSAVARHVRGTPAILVNDALAAHRPDAVARANAVAERIQAEAAANADARRQFAGRYLLQSLRNVPVIEREADIASLDRACVARPAVIAAAGPSLDRALATLAEYQHRVVVIAVDTALRPLLAAGVRPHLVVAVDPNELNGRHLVGIADTDGIWLAAEGSLHPAVFESFAGRTFIFQVSNHQPWPWLARAGVARGSLRAWGSVVTSALDLALRMGCNPIVFIGHDCAYTGGRPYCDNTTFHETWRAYLMETFGEVTPEGIREQEGYMLYGRSLVAATDINGDRVQTTGHLVAFRDWIAEQTTVTRDRTFINATGAGLLHGPRIAQMPLDAALRAHAGGPFDVRAVLAERHARTRGVAGRLASHHPSRDELAAWVDFTAGTVDRDAILAALRR